jgi:hypothetical protein
MFQVGNGAQCLKRRGMALRKLLNLIFPGRKKILLWQIIVTRKYFDEWMTAGVIQRRETLQRTIDLEPVCLRNAETSNL